MTSSRSFVALLAVILGLASVVPASADRRRHYGRDRHHHVHVDVHRRGGGAGTFIAGAIVGGAIASAARPPVVVVAGPAVVAPVVGVVVPFLPEGCTQIIRGGAMYQQCGGAYYQPYYQGASLSYRVVAF